MPSRSSLLPLLLLCTAAAASSTPSRNAELDALMELKAALDPSGRALASWARGGDPCGRGDYFEGVTCDARGRVATISLQGKGLAGTVPPAVAMLPALTGLYLHYNDLGGEIPRELGGLPDLAELYLGVNNLSGAIPVELGRLGSLQGDADFFEPFFLLCLIGGFTLESEEVVSFQMVRNSGLPFHH